MAKRPEGLSPNFNSIVSPQVPSSLIFSWSFIPQYSTDSQKSAQVKIYPKDSLAAIVTISAAAETEVNIAPYVNSFTLEDSYEWEVSVTASNNTIAQSGKKPFVFADVSLKGDLVWPAGPDPYEYIGTRRYFDEIRQNAIQVLGDYVNDSSEENHALENAVGLFSGDVVPARKDFTAIEHILNVIANKESSYRHEIDELVEDGLGSGDIHLIYSFFDRLTRIPPRAPSNIYMSFSSPADLVIEEGSAYNKGDSDLTVDVSWEPSVLTHGECSIHIGSELNEDISYYRFELDAGFNDYSVIYKLYYRVSDIESSGRRIDIPMSHVDFQHMSSAKTGKYVIRAYAIDKRDSSSSAYLKSYNVKVPLGVLSYRLRTQQRNLANTGTIRSYSDIYNGPNKAYVHTVTGKVDGLYTYAVKLFDINGDESPWFYIDSVITIDPLKPPPAPKPKLKAVDPDTVHFEWPAVTTAEHYEIDPQYGSGSTVTTKNLYIWYNGLTEKTKYTYKIRAVNRAGASAWVTMSGTTAAKPVYEHVQKSPTTRTWRTSYAIYKQNGRNVYPAAEYRTEMNNKEVIHGEWIELRDKYESGMYVKKGTRWGNHRSLFFLDYSGWQSKLKGKTIVSVQMYIKRYSFHHGYPDDGRFLYVWTHNYPNASYLPSEKNAPALANSYKVTNLDFDQGQGHWVTLPKSFGEKLRDGSIKGLALYHPDASKGPYSYMRFDARTFQLKIKYK
ncbi:fibronectin type III domain-containing protein [Cytobacillus oceanisediminis]|uniref:fibronectin type III domain-containing protein n=1 Tax=Cytobacillus oceanisediminis TaxID=665099 RepID=UPI001FB2E2D3|nr:fibronectin type III domain-containing protein [Cytobacillus oceanisediminis]UOE58070.1 fibronectin type III domain-containing protein [Cytobacillus oceanisediminis]